MRRAGLPRQSPAPTPGQAEFSGGTVRFTRGKLSSGRVGFSNAEFSGGTVDFSDAADWSFPPAFPWTDTPFGREAPQEGRSIPGVAACVLVADALRDSPTLVTQGSRSLAGALPEIRPVVPDVMGRLVNVVCQYSAWHVSHEIQRIDEALAA